MRHAPSATGAPLPPWLVLAGSAAILLHLAAVVVPILDSPSGPWPTPTGRTIDDPPAFAHALAGLAEWHADTFAPPITIISSSTGRATPRR